MVENQEQSIGALWSKQSKNGANYLSGSVEIDGKKTQIVVFKNKFKEQDKHPDWKIFISQPQNRQENSSTDNVTNANNNNEDNDPLPF